MSRLRLAALAAMLTCALTVGAVSTAAAQTTEPFTKRVAVTGTANNGKTFRGHYTINRFTKRHGKVFAVGTLRGHIGHRHVRRTGVRMPVKSLKNANAGAAQAAQAACNVLNLTLGPLDLNLLGLRVQLNQLHLVITAIPSPLPGSGLLGNLLCSLNNLLNPGTLTGLTPAQLVAILNALLALVPTTP